MDAGKFQQVKFLALFRRLARIGNCRRSHHTIQLWFQ
ncbi:hypothetical protein ES332_D03G145800v1 [Gossypium tomentosum]|uniref:Uncharacterized protein n=1 Tax=Gossypium tomentosum TaxID=34277 RepID=A0A5D2LMQ4_GOSTO|nr:hypothetical protein ES332_D03G145800v1 [Gossypium tomentosum]